MTRSRMKPALRAAVLILCAGLSVAATPKKALPQRAAAPAAWLNRIDVTDNLSHRIGNPDAPVRLTEYVSYTCPHCAHFHKESDPVLRQNLLPKGQVSITVTNFLRNPIDLTIAMLANCGDPKRFFVRHNAFFATQDAWMAKVQAATPEQQKRWYQGAMPERMRAITNDLGFYKTMQGWGINRAQTDACLASQPTLDKITAQQKDVERLNLGGTPSFTLNGETLEVHDWASVLQAINAKLAQARAGNI